MHFGIIAAGEGARLVQEGVALPKPLVELCGVPMIERLIGIFGNCGAESVSVIVNEQMTEVQSFLKDLRAKLSFPLNIKVKSTPSSMHSFYELASLMRGKGRFILTTVDTIFRPEEFIGYADRYAGAPADIDGMMAITPFVDDEKPLYVATDGDMNITAFRDNPADDTHYVSGGIYGLSESAIDVLDRCMNRGVSRMRNYQRALVEAGLRLRGDVFEKIVDVDHADDISKAEKFLKEKTQEGCRE